MASPFFGWTAELYEMPMASDHYTGEALAFTSVLSIVETIKKLNRGLSL